MKPHGTTERPEARREAFTLLEVLLAAALLALLLGYVGSALAQQARELRRGRADAAAVAGARLAASLMVEAARRYDELDVSPNGRRLRGRVERAGGGGRWALILSTEDRRPDRGQGEDLTPDSLWYNRAEGTLERCYDPVPGKWDRAVDGLTEVGLEIRRAHGEPGQPERWLALTVTAEPPGATGPYTLTTWLRLERP